MIAKNYCTFWKFLQRNFKVLFLSSILSFQEPLARLVGWGIANDCVHEGLVLEPFLRGGNSDTGFSPIPMFTYEEILPYVYSLHYSFN